VNRRRHRRGSVNGRKHLALTGVVVAFVVAGATMTGPAHAYQWWGGPGWVADPHMMDWKALKVLDIRSVSGWSDGSNHKVAVGIQNYAGLTEGWSYACHPYASPRYDNPGLHNPHSVSQQPMVGSWFTSNAC
jgi:hypothetical protein